MRIGLDLRWLQQTYRYSPRGAVGGVGTLTQGLWLGLARAFPDVELVALIDRGAVPQPLLDIIHAAPRHQVARVGLSGIISSLNSRGNYMLVMRLLESELGLGMNLKRLKLDVFHVLDHTSPPRRAPFPTVVTVCDTIGVEKKRGTRTFRASIGQALVRKHFLNFDRADIIVPISRSTKDNLLHYFPRRGDNYPIILPGIDLGPFEQPALREDDLRRRFCLDGGYFMHVGVVFERKNPQGLIRAMRRVIETCTKECCLVCIGPYQTHPEVHDRVVELTRECGIENHVRILGDVTSEELASLYRYALGLVFPSFAEGFGLPALECLASGTPCVVSKTTSLPEVVGDLGILVDPYSDKEIADGMCRLLNDETHRAKVKEQGPLWARRFSVEAMAVSYMELYQSLTQ